MTSEVMPDGVFAVSEDGYDPTAYSGRHAMAPVLVGLAVPPIAIIYAFPDLAKHAEFFFVLYLSMIMAVSGFMFVRAIFNPAHVVSANFDPRQRSVELVRHSQWGNTSVYVPFKDIADVFMRVRYDDDGYTFREPVLRLRNDDEYELPTGTDQEEITRIREMLGRK